MFYLYIIQSEKTGRYYVGSCENVDIRLDRHNQGATPSTKSGRPWKLVYKEKYSSRTEALKRESEIKKKKSRKYIEFLINCSNG